MRNEAARWLAEALRDLESAEILFKSGRYNACCFYSQQSGEKAAKALLYKLNEAPWGHSVRDLLERYIEKTGDREAESLIDCAKELDRHYIPSRYPNAHPSGTAFEAYDATTAKRAVDYARKILEYVSKVLG